MTDAMPEDDNAHWINLRRKLHGNLLAFERHGIAADDLTPAAVAIVLSASDQLGETEFLLTRRTSGLNNHGGQFALPGGRLDSGESVIEAACRELHEELNINLTRSSVIGILDDYASRSGYCITPVVLWCDDLRDLRPSPAEVAHVYRIPVRDLASSANPVVTEIPESSRPVLSMQLDSLGHQVYSPTAAMLYQFYEVAIRGRATRVAHYEQPVFAWK